MATDKPQVPKVIFAEGAATILPSQRHVRSGWIGGPLGNSSALFEVLLDKTMGPLRADTEADTKPEPGPLNPLKEEADLVPAEKWRVIDTGPSTEMNTCAFGDDNIRMHIRKTPPGVSAMYWYEGEPGSGPKSEWRYMSDPITYAQKWPVPKEGEISEIRFRETSPCSCYRAIVKTDAGGTVRAAIVEKRVSARTGYDPDVLGNLKLTTKTIGSEQFEFLLGLGWHCSTLGGRSLVSFDGSHIPLHTGAVEIFQEQESGKNRTAYATMEQLESDANKCESFGLVLREWLTPHAQVQVEIYDIALSRPTKKTIGVAGTNIEIRGTPTGPNTGGIASEFQFSVDEINDGRRSPKLAQIPKNADETFYTDDGREIRILFYDSIIKDSRRESRAIMVVDKTKPKLEASKPAKPEPQPPTAAKQRISLADIVVCKYCGEMNTPDHKKCVSCGGVLPQNDESVSRPSVAPIPSVAPTPSAMRSPDQPEPITQKAKRPRTSDAPATVTCDKCGHSETPVHYKFCLGCGHELPKPPPERSGIPDSSPPLLSRSEPAAARPPEVREVARPIPAPEVPSRPPPLPRSDPMARTVLASPPPPAPRPIATSRPLPPPPPRAAPKPVPPPPVPRPVASAPAASPHTTVAPPGQAARGLGRPTTDPGLGSGMPRAPRAPGPIRASDTPVTTLNPGEFLIPLDRPMTSYEIPGLHGVRLRYTGHSTTSTGSVAYFRLEDTAGTPLEDSFTVSTGIASPPLVPHRFQYNGRRYSLKERVIRPGELSGMERAGIVFKCEEEPNARQSVGVKVPVPK